MTVIDALLSGSSSGHWRSSHPGYSSMMIDRAASTHTNRMRGGWQRDQVRWSASLPYIDSQEECFDSPSPNWRTSNCVRNAKMRFTKRLFSSSLWYFLCHQPSDCHVCVSLDNKASQCYICFETGHFPRFCAHPHRRRQPADVSNQYTQCGQHLHDGSCDTLHVPTRNGTQPPQGSNRGGGSRTPPDPRTRE